MRSIALSIAALFLSACASTPAPVPVLGASSEVRQLEGQWSGQYRSPETGGSGLITFNLNAGTDTAFGDVIMVPRNQGRPPVEQSPGAPRMPMSQVLTIRYVRVTGGTISGIIEPYRSPDCDCLVRTFFRGEIRGDRITGDFVTENATDAGVRQRGTWTATRQPPPTGPCLG